MEVVLKGFSVLIKGAELHAGQKLIALARQVGILVLGRIVSLRLSAGLIKIMWLSGDYLMPRRIS